MTEAAKILAECRQLLADQRQQLETFLGDPRVFHWRKISSEVHGELLQALGVSAEAGKVASRFHEQVHLGMERLDACRNELANQETDLQFSPGASERTLAAANKLAQECARLRQPLAHLRTTYAMLCEAESTLRQKLRLENLITLAEKKSGAKSGAFDAGYRIFSLLTGLGSAAGNVRNFQEQFAEAIELKSRLDHIDLQGLPCLAAEIVQQQLAMATEAVEQVKNVLDHGRNSLSFELDAVRQLSARTAALSRAPLSDLLQEINEITAGLSDCILNFSYKQHVVKKLQAVTAILEDLKLFNRALKGDVLVALKAETGTPGSPLNPATLAARNADTFFAGLTGFWRMLRLFFHAAGGGKPVDALSLQLLLEQAINNCTAYRGSREVDLENLQAFMAVRLQDYRTPFPREELRRLMKRTLDAYADRVEKTLHGHRLGDELLKECSGGTTFLKAGSLTFGNLLRKVQRLTDQLERGLA